LMNSIFSLKDSSIKKIANKKKPKVETELPKMLQNNS